jgi:hypothetical protein
MKRVRSEGGHAWTLKGKCRFCGMARADFKLQNRPDCDWQAIKVGRAKIVPQANE